jgi:hypothetical protein
MVGWLLQVQVHQSGPLAGQRWQSLQQVQLLLMLPQMLQQLLVHGQMQVHQTGPLAGQRRQKVQGLQPLLMQMVV